MVLCGRSLEAYLKVILPRHVGITASLVAINSLSLGRRRQVIDTMAGSSLPVLHLSDGRGKGANGRCGCRHQMPAFGVAKSDRRKYEAPGMDSR